jgi:CubicO group peptidase (beta-lactamase class C family)
MSVPALDQVAGWPAPFASAGVTDAAATIATTGDVDRRHQWASVTKLVTALCVLRLCDSGALALDEPAGPPGSTVRHLLAHASGLGFDAGAVTLGQPGRRRVYSNVGFDLLGTIVTTRCGLAFADYAAQAVFEPLSMAGSAIEGTPAAGGVGPLTDLLRLGRELLAPTLVSAPLMALASSVAFPGLPGVLPGIGRFETNDWGLGFEIRDSKSPHWTGHTNAPSTFGHFGQTGSFLWVDPSRGLACTALTSVTFGPWAAAAWPVFSDAVLAEYAPPSFAR